MTKYSLKILSIVGAGLVSGMAQASFSVEDPSGLAQEVENFVRAGNYSDALRRGDLAEYQAVTNCDDMGCHAEWQRIRVRSVTPIKAVFESSSKSQPTWQEAGEISSTVFNQAHGSYLNYEIIQNQNAAVGMNPLASGFAAFVSSLRSPFAAAGNVTLTLLRTEQEKYVLANKTELDAIRIEMRATETDVNGRTYASGLVQVFGKNMPFVAQALWSGDSYQVLQSLDAYSRP
ncbi:MAG: hypothetical protein JST16_11550 [Bdellovibrionales bacterium]|nr:hypothetical protein [Bdellovibrionales bacterium]